MMLFIYCFVLIMTQVGDYLSTIFALRKSSAKEYNPIVRALGLLPTKILTAVVMCAIATILYPQSPGIVLGMVLLFTGLYAVVIWHNFTI